MEASVRKSAFIIGRFPPVSWMLMRPYIGVPPPTVRAVSSKCSPQFKPDQVNTAEENTCDVRKEESASWWEIITIYGDGGAWGQ